MDFSLPDPSVIERYEKLDIVGILLLWILMLLILVAYIMRRVSSGAKTWFEFMGKQTQVMTEVRDSHERLADNITIYHSRVDRILECSSRECPVRSIRQQPADISAHPVMSSASRHASGA